VCVSGCCSLVEFLSQLEKIAENCISMSMIILVPISLLVFVW
jgi:hypothetical protein